MALTRRQLLAALPAGLLVPRALAETSARRFLFVHADGGWDPTYVFAPVFDNPQVDMPPNSTAAEAHGIPFVDAASRPSVRLFFEQNASRTCILNGVEVRSVAHERCRRILLTGGPGEGDDWGSILASHGDGGLLLPYAVASGYAFTQDHADRVVRIGSSSQLPNLLGNNALTMSDMWAPPLDEEDAVDAYVRARAGAMEGDFARRYARALDDVAGVQQLAGDLSFGAGVDFLDQVTTVLDCLGNGISRCAMLRHDGLWGNRWDTHAGNSMQDQHFELLFGDLRGLMDGIDERGLQDEITVVVVSEMGRHPKLNQMDGKHHWTTTSAMFIGAGVLGNQVVGHYDENMAGQYLAGHLGATVLALGDVDPGPYTELEPIEEVLL